MFVVLSEKEKLPELAKLFSIIYVVGVAPDPPPFLANELTVGIGPETDPVVTAPNSL